MLQVGINLMNQAVEDLMVSLDEIRKLNFYDQQDFGKLLAEMYGNDFRKFYMSYDFEDTLD